MKKFLSLFIGVIFGLGSAFADPIVELAAPRIQAPKIISDDGSSIKPATSPNEAKSDAKTKNGKSASKKHKKHIHKKPRPFKLNYGHTTKLIEYGYYDEADRLLRLAINTNSKDIKAQALWATSLAKQNKLDAAQFEIDDLMKKNSNNSDLHYAQGIVDFKRTTSSNMFYRNNTNKLLSDALKEFEKAIKLDKTNAKAYNAAGVTSLSLGKTKEAKDYFKKAYETDKTYSTAIDNLGTMDYIDGKYADAEKKFKQALTFNQANSTAMYHLAQIYFQKNDYKNALFQLNNALAINPNSPAIYNLMGKSYRAQGNEAAAINSFKKSIEIKPEFTVSYTDLANIYEKRGDSDFAIEQLKTAIAIDPKFNFAKLKIADISLSQGNYNQAIAFYSQIVGIDKYTDAALIGLANAYYGQAQTVANKAVFGSNKELFKALENINCAIKLNNDNLELHLAKLKLSKVTNQADLSRKALDEIINSKTQSLINSVVKGEAYLTLNDYTNAQKMFDDAISQSKSNSDDLYLAEIFILHKQYASAEKVLHKVLKNDVSNQEASSDLDYIQKCKKYANNYFKTAQSFIKAKNTSAATEYLSRTIAIDPSNAQAYLFLAQIYEKEKNYQEAADNYKTYLNLEPNSAYNKSVEKKIKHMQSRL